MSTTPLAEATAQACPEAQVLLYCAQTCYNPASAAQLPRLLHPDFHWDSLIRLALRHRVLPLVYRSMQAIGANLAPPSVWADLQHHFHANAQRNLLLGGTLLRLLRLLARHDISAIPYKGPVLAMVAYGNLALRQFGDLDILVRQQDVERAKDLLLAQGYRWWEQRPITLLPRQRKVYELISADSQVLVELHWAVTSSTFYFPLDPARLWERLETVVLLGLPVRTLTPESLLLILCVHGAKHHWHRLAWICDIAALLHVSAEMDWQHLLAQADQLGCRRMLLLGVLLAQTLLGTTLSEPLQHRLHADAAIPRLAQEVQARLFIDTRRPLAAVDRPLFYLRLRERLRDRLRCSCYLVYHTITSRLLSAFGRAVPRQNRRRGDQELGQEGKEHGQTGEK
jgi:putative nucleotidyltransferase-like protein